MKAVFIPPRAEINNLIDSIGVFEIEGSLSKADCKMIVPNGNFKMIIPFNKGVSSTIGNFNYSAGENEITLVGASNLPFYAGEETGNNSSTVVFEFKPQGAYRFFKLNFLEFKNKIFKFTDVLGEKGKELQLRIAEKKEPKDKIEIVQLFLIESMRNSQDAIFEFCLQNIYSSNGTVTVNNLEKKTGYSRRWLNQKFNNNLGLSTKSFASVVKFQKIYNHVLSGRYTKLFDFYDLYYDQSHFINDFKRFTGFSPEKLRLAENNFGKLFYKL